MGVSDRRSGDVVIGQVQAVDIDDPHKAQHALLESKTEILALANSMEPPKVNNQRYMQYYVMYRLAKNGRGNLRYALA